MNTVTKTTVTKINKLHVQELVFFATTHIPNVDRATLDKFLALVNADKTHSVLNQAQLMTKIQLTLKYIPNACPHTLMILADLLELGVTTIQTALAPPDSNLVIDGSIIHHQPMNTIAQ